jgi:4'-phosphopantetheinyl transferase
MWLEMIRRPWPCRKPTVVLLDREGISENSFYRIRSLLTTAERANIDDLESEPLRRRYAAGRGVLRLLLFALTGNTPPERLFTGDDTGPPLPVTTPPDTVLNFSVSHTERYTVFGFLHAGRIGVDIEKVRPVRYLEDSATYAFSPAESNWIQQLPEERRQKAFFRIWTRKEAVIKCCGGTVANDMDRFEIALDEDTVTYRLDRPPLGGAERPWLADLDLVTGFFCAVCWENSDKKTAVKIIGTGFIERWLRRYSAFAR